LGRCPGCGRFGSRGARTPCGRSASREAHGESRHGHIPFSEAKFLRACARLLARPETSLALVVERGGEVVGLLVAAVGEHFLGGGGGIATVQVLYVSGRLRGTALGGRVAARLMRLFRRLGAGGGRRGDQRPRDLGHRPGADGQVLQAARAAAVWGELCGEAVRRDAGVLSTFEAHDARR